MRSHQKLVKAIGTAAASFLFATCSYVGRKNLLDCFTDSVVPVQCRGEPLGLSLFPQPRLLPGIPQDLEAIVLGEMKPLESHPEFKRRLAQRARSPETVAEAHEMGRQFGQELVARGIARLLLRDLDEWNRLKLAMALNSDSLCSSFWTGNPSPEMLFAGLSGLSRADLKAWAQLSARAGILELEAPAPLPPDTTALAEGLKNIGQVISEQERSNLASTIQSGSAAAAVDACRAFRVMMSGAQQLEPDLRRRFLSAVARLD